MGECDDLVRLRFQGLFDFLQGWTLADASCLQVCDIGSVGLEALTEGVTEVAGVEDECVLAALDQIGGDEVPAEGSTAGDEEWLCGFVGGLEEFADKS